MSAVSGIRREVVDTVVEAVLDEIAKALAAGRKVNLRGFGVFELRHRGATQKRKPDTGEIIQVDPYVTVGFRPSPTLKRRIEEERSANSSTN